MTTLWRTILTLALGSTLSFSIFAADSGAIKGLWDFTINEQSIQVPVPTPTPVPVFSLVPVPGLGSQGASTLTSDEDFAPNRAGNELITFATRSECTPFPVPTLPPNEPYLFSWRFKDLRIFVSTEGDELARFDVPTISLENVPGTCLDQFRAPLTNRSSSAFARDNGERVYVYTRAFYPPMVPLAGVWYIGVFGLDGTLLWDRTFRPLDQNSDDYLWNIVPSRSAVGPLLSQGKNKDVIRIFRTKFIPPPVSALMNRYTFFDLNGKLIKDVTYTVDQPDL